MVVYIPGYSGTSEIEKVSILKFFRLKKKKTSNIMTCKTLQVGNLFFLILGSFMVKDKLNVFRVLINSVAPAEIVSIRYIDLTNSFVSVFAKPHRLV